MPDPRRGRVEIVLPFECGNKAARLGVAHVNVRHVGIREEVAHRVLDRAVIDSMLCKEFPAETIGIKGKRNEAQTLGKTIAFREVIAFTLMNEDRSRQWIRIPTGKRIVGK